MRYQLKDRLKELNKKQVDLIFALREQYGIEILPNRLSDFINDVVRKGADHVLEKCDKIVTEWEKEAKNRQYRSEKNDKQRNRKACN